MLFQALAALLLAHTVPLSDEEPTISPTMNLNAIHLIHCLSKDGDEYTGTGWLIAKDTIATANHVAGGAVCVDETTQVPIKAYKQDPRHDFALMTAKEPEDEPYIKYTCKRPKAHKAYVAYGITSYGYDWGHELVRNNTVIATSRFEKNPDLVEGLDDSSGMRDYVEATAPGMSGGPVVDPDTGYAYALVNAGDDRTSLFFDLADTILCH